MFRKIQTRLTKNSVLLLPFLLLAALSAFWSQAPLERDIATYAVIARDLLNTPKKLYVNLWDHKPPGIHMVYEFFFYLFGPTDSTLHLLGFISGATTLLVSFLIFRDAKLSRSLILFGLLIVALWVHDPYLEAYQPNTESFLLPLILIAIYLLKNFRLRYLSLSGTVIAIASVFKPVAFAPWGTILVLGIFSQKIDLSYKIKSLASAILPIVLFWIGVLSYYAFCNSFSIFISTVVTYNTFYSGSLFSNLWHGLIPKNLFPRCLIAFLPFFIILVFSLKKLRTHRELIALVLGTYIAVVTPGHFYNHYYQLWIVPFVYALASIEAAPRKSILVVTFLITLSIESFYMSFGALGWSERRHGVQYLEDRNIANQMIGKTFFQLGSNTSIYWYANRSPPTTVFYSGPLIDGPNSNQLMGQTTAELRSSKPSFVLISSDWFSSPLNETPIMNFISNTYQLPMLSQSFKGEIIIAPLNENIN